MTAMPPTTPPSAPSRRFRFTREQYYEMGRLGYFGDARVELIFGEVAEMSPVNWPHHLAVGLVSDVLAATFATGFFIDIQQSFPIPNEPIGTAPQPDAAVIPGSRRSYTDHPTATVLLVEVSDSTLDYDLTTKAELYATAGVPEYWVLDLNGRELHVFRDPQPLPTALGGTAYHTHLTLGAADSVSPLAAPHASVPVDDLLP